ncbi:MAG: ATP synthase F0 subunit B [Patescibacteria group bacterium]
MEAILTTFGIDWHLLLINAINFGLLLAGLTYFLYKPILGMLEERRKKVAEGVLAAAAAEERLAQTEGERTQKLAVAGREADEILAAARKAGEARELALQARGEAAAAQAVVEAQMQAQELKERALRESKEEVAKLIVLGIEKTHAKH